MDPPELDFENLGDIIGSLSQEDIDRLAGLAGQFMGGEKAEEPRPNETGGSFNLDPDMIFRLMNIMQKLQSRQNDPRCNLIASLKPLLSPERRQKADKAIELLRLMSIFSLGDIFGME